MFNSLKVGFYLAIKDITRASILTTILIVFIMTLTFLNLTVGRGILVGLPKGATNVYDERYSGDLIISKLRKDSYIVNEQAVENYYNKLPEIRAVTKRYLHSATLTSDYDARLKNSEVNDSTSGILTGINPIDEDKVTGLSKYIVEGAYLDPKDREGILVGASMLFRYSPLDSPSESTIKNLNVGDKVRITIKNKDYYYIVRGVIKSKVSEVDRRIFINIPEYKLIAGEKDFKPEEISFKFFNGTDPVEIKNKFYAEGLQRYAKIQTAVESQPKFLNDIGLTFDILGNILGAIGIIVASVTVFIVIFVNAITRRKFIGILKAIGVTSLAIEFSYILQAIFYAFLGSIIGMSVLYGFFVPFFDQNPINFPFADGILYAPLSDSLSRFGILLIASVISGFIPARIVVKQKTLDAILGR
jgi:ABC-type lipoprotein release transport system permease subunit